MERAEVLVVGAGPAGSTLAWELGRRGVDVAVLDREAFPRDKVCAGWITPAVVRALRLDTAEYSRGRVFQPIHGFRVGLIGGREKLIRFHDEPVSFGILRCEFDDYLLRRSGARLRLGEPFRKIEREAGGWRVNGALWARLVVGAGGHFCPVARLLGATSRQAGTVVAQEVEFQMTRAEREACAVDPAIPELYFCPDLEGYGWIFRKGDHLNVGLGRQDPHGLSEHVTAFCKLIVERGRVPESMPRKFHGHAYRLYPDATHSTFDDGLLLIGDAAGLAYPQSGEGIRPAIESGLLAARVILDAAGDYRRDRLAGYPHLLAERFGPRRGTNLARLLPRPLRTAVGARLLTTTWFARRIVLERWFLHRHQPALPTDEPVVLRPAM